MAYQVVFILAFLYATKAGREVCPAGKCQRIDFRHLYRHLNDDGKLTPEQQPMTEDEQSSSDVHSDLIGEQSPAAAPAEEDAIVASDTHEQIDSLQPSEQNPAAGDAIAVSDLDEQITIIESNPQKDPIEVSGLSHGVFSASDLEKTMASAGDPEKGLASANHDVFSASDPEKALASASLDAFSAGDPEKGLASLVSVGDGYAKGGMTPSKHAFECLLFDRAVQAFALALQVFKIDGAALGFGHMAWALAVFYNQYDEGFKEAITAEGVAVDPNNCVSPRDYPCVPVGGVTVFNTQVVNGNWFRTIRTFKDYIKGVLGIEDDADAYAELFFDDFTSSGNDVRTFVKNLRDTQGSRDLAACKYLAGAAFPPACVPPEKPSDFPKYTRVIEGTSKEDLAEILKRDRLLPREAMESFLAEKGATYSDILQKGLECRLEGDVAKPISAEERGKREDKKVYAAGRKQKRNAARLSASGGRTVPRDQRE